MSNSEFYPDGVYDSNIPTIESVLRYKPGEKLTRYTDLEKYIKTLADLSDQVLIRKYAKSYEGRTLYYLIISSPDNIERIDEIKADISKLSDPRSVEEDELERIVDETPAITWIGANVHGNEHSTAEAAMLLAYQLTAGEDETTQTILRESVVIIDPLQNPDGRERSLNYFYSVAGIEPTLDKNAAEHHEHWPYGRGNHYFFDLNRDWFPITQEESLGKVKSLLEWRPQVYADLHEMGHNSTYYFLPPAPPINTNMPKQIETWWKIYGKGNAKAFDKLGFEYYTRETFDVFYPGYGESWPTLLGATGMTYEQASARGLRIKRKDKTILTLSEAIRHHFTAAMATCQTTAKHRSERLRDFYLYHKTAIEEGRSSKIKEFLIVPSNKKLNVKKFVSNLMRQGIEVAVAKTDFIAREVHAYDGKPVYEKEMPKGTYMIRLDQPHKRLIKALFEKEAELDENFLKEELERREKKLPSRIYDITAWSLPLAYDIDVYWTERFSDVEMTNLNSSPKSQGKIGRKASIAYLLKYTSNNAAKCLADLLQNDFNVHVARKSFTLDGEEFDRGTIVIKVQKNKDGLYAKLKQLTEEHGVDLVPTDTSWTEEGIALGSGNVVYLKKPRIAILYDRPVSTLSYGWMAYLLEQCYGLKFTPVRANILTADVLKDYNVIIFPNGSPGEYEKFVGKTGIDRLKSWIQSGGTLIGIKGGMDFLVKDEFKLTTSTRIKDLRKLEQDEKQNEKDKDEPILHKHKPVRVPGAILKVKFDMNHFLSYGYNENTNVLINSNYVFMPSKGGRNIATFVDESELKTSGFVWEKMKKALSEKAYLIDEPTGRGHVILYADDPNFRACWDGLNRLFLNSIFFAPSLKR